MKLPKHIDGHHYSDFHPNWGNFIEELFFYTSRYYGVTEAFLRCLIDCRDFSMSGYKAKNLSALQRPALASILTYPPNRETGLAVASIVEKVIKREVDVDETILKYFPPLPMKTTPSDKCRNITEKLHKLDLSPIEPWLSMAKRLQMPVAVREHHVEVDMHVLTEHLNSPNRTIRTNLINDIIALHQAGYSIRDHSHLTHAEAFQIGDEGAV
jgi:hypothetical protein